METTHLITELKALTAEIPTLMKIEEGFHHPHIKAWKTKVGELLEEGGSTCRKPLDILKGMRNTIGGDDFVNRQTFLNQLEALQRGMKESVHTIEVFGRPDKKDNLPNWGKPKSQQRAVGHLMVGDEEISTDNITIHEVLDCLVSLAEDSNDLSKDMREKVINGLKIVLDDDLLQPFLTRKLDTLLGHWPEFQTK